MSASHVAALVVHAAKISGSEASCTSKGNGHLGLLDVAADSEVVLITTEISTWSMAPTGPMLASDGPPR